MCSLIKENKFIKSVCIKIKYYSHPAIGQNKERSISHPHKAKEGEVFSVADPNQSCCAPELVAPSFSQGLTFFTRLVRTMCGLERINDVSAAVLSRPATPSLRKNATNHQSTFCKLLQIPHSC